MGGGAQRDPRRCALQTILPTPLMAPLLRIFGSSVNKYWSNVTKNAYLRREIDSSSSEPQGDVAPYHRRTMNNMRCWHTGSPHARDPPRNGHIQPTLTDSKACISLANVGSYLPTSRRGAVWSHRTPAFSTNYK